MCGRYFIDSGEPTMGTMLSALSPETPIRGGEVFPSNMAPVITRHGELTTMLWGFPRFDGKGLMINARSETAAEKPMFRTSMQYGRCLIPASWYFEWEQPGNWFRFPPRFDGSTCLRFPCRGALYMRPYSTAGTAGPAGITARPGRHVGIPPYSIRRGCGPGGYKIRPYGPASGLLVGAACMAAPDCQKTSLKADVTEQRGMCARG